MLEFWYKDKRTLVDFRRGLLGPHFDGFAAYLQARGYASHGGRTVLSKCCQFNAFLLEQRVASVAELSESHIDSFLKLYFKHAPAGAGYSPRQTAHRAVRHLFDYLIQIKVLQPEKPKRIVKPYSWLLDPYTRHLRMQCQFSEPTIKRCVVQVSELLEAMGRMNRRNRFKNLKAKTVERVIKRMVQKSTDP